jgi:chromosome segregation ATPase
MDYLKEFFETEGADKSFDAFSKWCKEKGYKLEDLNKGDYVGKAKSEGQLKALEKKLADEFAAKEAALKAEFATVEAGYKEKEEKYAAEAKEKEAKAAATMTEGERLAKELQKQLDDLTKQNATATKKHDDLTKQIEAIRAEGEKAKEQGTRDKREALYMKAGGKEKNVSRDIDFLTKQITEEIPFETVLENYRKENSELFTSETTTVSTAPNFGGGAKPDGDSDKEIAALRRGAGLPEKT